jgi:hypothetical protein
VLSYLRSPRRIVGIAFDQNQITCSWIEQTNTLKKKFTLKAYSAYLLQHSEYKEAHIYNITQLKRYISSFLKYHNLHDSFIIISLKGPGLSEKIISISTELPSENHLYDTTKNTLQKNRVWDYLLLSYNQSTKKYHYYLCGITREQLFQQQALALMASYNCIGIMPHRAALLYACQHLYQNQWKTTTINNHGSLQNFIHYCADHCDVDSIFTGAHTSTQIEKTYLLESLGLFLAGKECYEHY